MIGRNSATNSWPVLELAFNHQIYKRQTFWFISQQINSSIGSANLTATTEVPPW